MMCGLKVEKEIWLMVIFIVSWQGVLYCGTDPFVSPWDRKREQTISRNEDFSYSDQSLNGSQDIEDVEKDFYKQDNQQEDYEIPKEELPKKPELDVHGLIWGSDGKGVAILGDKVFHVGDVVENGCIIRSIVNGVLIVQCKDRVWKYRVGGGGS